MQVGIVTRVAKASADVSKLLHEYSRKSGGLQKVGWEVLQIAQQVLAPRAALIRKTKELFVVSSPRH